MESRYTGAVWFFEEFARQLSESVECGGDRQTRRELQRAVLGDFAKPSYKHQSFEPGKVVAAGGELRHRLRERNYVVYSSDQRVKVDATGLYTYPDVTVICDQPQFDDNQQDTLLNPLVLLEVLSPTTADYDRGGKFKQYRGLPSLQEYVLISQDQPFIEHFVRDCDRWVLTEIDSLNRALDLPSLGCELPLSEIYLKVQFGAPS